MTQLFSSGTIGPLTIKNRIVMPPMCMFYSDDNGYPNTFHYTHYTSRAINGVGLIILEATAVTKQGRITDTDLGIWSDDHIKPLTTLVNQIHEFDSKIIIQLAHAGRKCGVDSEINIGPSAIELDDRYETPIEMTVEMIEDFKTSMKLAAQRAVQAGFDGIEIHAAHGYLISQFLSPLANQRTDQYGGTPENRVRLLKEVIDTVKSVMPESMALMIRISAEEYVDGGLHPEDFEKMFEYIDLELIDAIDVSTGGVVLADIDVYPGYQTLPAEKIKSYTKAKTISGGLINDPILANEMIANNRCDYVFVGRGLLLDDNWVLKAQSKLGKDVEWPTPYKRSLSNLKFI